MQDRNQPNFITPDEALAVLGALGALAASHAIGPNEYLAGCEALLRDVADTVMWEAAMPSQN